MLQFAERMCHSIELTIIFETGTAVDVEQSEPTHNTAFIPVSETGALCQHQACELRRAVRESLQPLTVRKIQELQIWQCQDHLPQSCTPCITYEPVMSY